ncbi:MAG: Dam family site-specific DNA-(adenine-N6)-methyltransferase, partial [Candidatus Thermoplasmatota archaeon]|nr:Dam family site-specific DNA-(adenine-N6)-methyltransferase [Candidatus Thermoplasmatota archaeon]
NRTGFNGLWRVNSRGEFNVPFGDYRKLVLPRASGLEEVSHLLGPVKFMELDFAETLRDAVMGDFAYLDPPYIPVSRSSSFTQYTSGGFGMNDQERLRDLCLALKQRGVRFILSNSDVPEIWRIYSDFSHEVIEARRSINSIPVGRKGHTECIITSVG